MIETIEGHRSVNKSVKQYAQGPAVHLWPSVRPPIDNFRRGVEWAPTERLQELVLLVQVGKPKVRNLNITVVIEQYIFQLQVPVDHTILK